MNTNVSPPQSAWVHPAGPLGSPRPQQGFTPPSGPPPPDNRGYNSSPYPPQGGYNSGPPPQNQWGPPGGSYGGPGGYGSPPPQGGYGGGGYGQEDRGKQSYIQLRNDFSHACPVGWFNRPSQQQQPQVVYQQAPAAPKKQGMGIGTAVLAGMWITCLPDIIASFFLLRRCRSGRRCAIG